MNVMHRNWSKRRYRFIVASGVWLWLLDHLGCDGLTMPWRKIYIRYEHCYDKHLRAHEICHIRQIESLGPVRFSVLYLWQLYRYGYWSMPLEVEARNFADRFHHLNM